MQRNWGLIDAASLSGCASQPTLLHSTQAMAVDTALAKGEFDMNCPAAQGSVLSRQFIQPPMPGPRMAPVGIDRANTPSEYRAVTNAVPIWWFAARKWTAPGTAATSAP